jgi:hypothetical protein
VNSIHSNAQAGPEIGAPVQLSDFRPVTCEALVRLGGTDDGGYVVPLDAVKAARALISFGLSHDWSFERDFRRHNAEAIIHCYDHTVSLITAFQYSISQLLLFFVRSAPRSLAKAFRWIDYIVFFRADRIHFRQRVWRDNQIHSATIEDVFGRVSGNRPVFVKMDIEGGEYRVIDDLLRHSKDIVAMTVEFHDVDILPSLFNSIVEKIKRDFYIVHIHANNIGGTAPFNFPIVPEITFLNKSFFNSAPPPSRLKYPVPGLDRPNQPRLPDFTFEF